MEIENRKSVMKSMDVFDPMAKENSFIEVTEWTNGEGWDIAIDERMFRLHFTELAAINYLVKHLEYGNKEKD